MILLLVVGLAIILPFLLYSIWLILGWKGVIGVVFLAFLGSLIKQDP